MIRSMTGFGTATCENDDYRITAEIKTVNQRFLDINFIMPKALFAAEIELRSLIARYISRGKVEVRITFTDKREKKLSVQINKELAIRCNEALKELSDALKLPVIDDVAKIAAFDGILTITDEMNRETSPNDSFELLKTTTQNALVELVKMRTSEGGNLRNDFIARLKTIDGIINPHLADLSNVIVKEYRERLEKKLTDILPEGSTEIDYARLVQEVAIYTDKTDFSEEIVRLQSHLAQFSNIIGTDKQEDPSPNAYEPIGRKLDFLLQEINREVNTIGSKASNIAAAQICVTLKSEFEKLREQVQNIE